MVNTTTFTNFLEVATKMFPLTGMQHHTLILANDGRLTAMILIADISMWWYCTPDTDEEWENAKETLTILKESVEKHIKENQ